MKSVHWSLFFMYALLAGISQSFLHVTTTLYWNTAFCLRCEVKRFKIRDCLSSIRRARIWNHSSAGIASSKVITNRYFVCIFGCLLSIGKRFLLEKHVYLKSSKNRRASLIETTSIRGAIHLYHVAPSWIAWSTKSRLDGHKVCGCVTLVFTLGIYGK